MEMPKLLIADACDEFRQELQLALAELGLVRCCSTGAQALELLRSFRPDILILDLMLPEIDGISLLHRAAEEELHFSVLATSRFTSDYVTSAMGRLGVDYIMAKPCEISAVVAHISDLAAELTPAVVTQADLYSAGSNLLLGLGFSVKLDGFTYLQAALPLYAADPEQAITKELYASVGKLYNKDGRQVERSIRNAIDIAWKNRDDHKWQAFFPVLPGGQVPRPSNGNLIARLAHYLIWHVQSGKQA